jgi:hypothetical protein
MKRIYLLVLLLSSNLSWAQEQAKSKTNANIVYSYKKYEKFDLGNLEIQGSVVTPGDLSVKERSRKSFERVLLNRADFSQEIQQDILKMR